MKLSNIIVLIICATILGCSSSKPIHPPRTEETKINLMVKWANSVTVGYIYNSLKEYDFSEKQSNMLWIEETIRRGHESKYITSFEQQKWVRKFYANYLFENKELGSYSEFQEKVKEYSSENPPPIKEKVTVDAIINASGKSDGWKKGVQIELPKGIWRIRPTAGGWSAWSDKKSWTWNVQIKRPFTDESFEFGPSNWWQFSSLEEAENYATNKLGVYPINMPNQGTVYFWIYDEGGDIANNRGYVTFEISNM